VVEEGSLLSLPSSSRKGNVSSMKRASNESTKDGRRNMKSWRMRCMISRNKKAKVETAP
jgi:hypothetical protein